MISINAWIFVELLALLIPICLRYKSISGHRSLSYFFSAPSWFLFFVTPILAEVYNANTLSATRSAFNITSMYIFSGLITGTLKESINFSTRLLFVLFITVLHGWAFREYLVPNDMVQRVSLHLLLNILVYIIMVVILTTIDEYDEQSPDEDEFITEDEPVEYELAYIIRDSQPEQYESFESDEEVDAYIIEEPEDELDEEWPNQQVLDNINALMPDSNISVVYYESESDEDGKEEVFIDEQSLSDDERLTIRALEQVQNSHTNLRQLVHQMSLDIADEDD